MASTGKHRKHRYRKVTFKFSKREYEVLEKCAELESTTINKFVKRNIRNGIDEMMPRLKVWLDQLQPENQLKLFADNEFDEPEIVQKSMVEEYNGFYENEKKGEKQ